MNSREKELKEKARKLTYQILERENTSFSRERERGPPSPTHVFVNLKTRVSYPNRANTKNLKKQRSKIAKGQRLNQCHCVNPNPSFQETAMTQQ